MYLIKYFAPNNVHLESQVLSRKAIKPPFMASSYEIFKDGSLIEKTALFSSLTTRKRRLSNSGIFRKTAKPRL